MSVLADERKSTEYHVRVFSGADKLIPLVHDDPCQLRETFHFFISHEIRKFDAAADIDRNVHPAGQYLGHAARVVDAVL
jgi:hypothetical protein